MWTVLYVEDEENDAYFMRRSFVRAGLEGCLNVVGDGQAAIDYLAGRGPFADRLKYPLPAVALLDLNLPTVSGFELLQWIRQQAEFQRLPVVIFSSSSRAEDRLRARALGASDYLEKPDSGSEFGGIVEVLNCRWHEQPATPAMFPQSPSQAAASGLARKP